jgi:DNA polymerase-3 subunit gamma/tau
VIRSYPGKHSQVSDKSVVPSCDQELEKFLAFLYAQKELEIYYFLLNYTEIKRFTDEQIEILLQTAKLDLQNSISQLLFTWTGRQWRVVITKQQDITPLKEWLVNKFKTSQDWQILHTAFPSTEICDIFLPISDKGLAQ